MTKHENKVPTWTKSQMSSSGGCAFGRVASGWQWPFCLSAGRGCFKIRRPFR
jgi:hypothetical protein